MECISNCRNRKACTKDTITVLRHKSNKNFQIMLRLSPVIQKPCNFGRSFIFLIKLKLNQ